MKDETLFIDVAARQAEADLRVDKMREEGKTEAEMHSAEMKLFYDQLPDPPTSQRIPCRGGYVLIS